MTVKNISEKAFIDGDLVIDAGQTADVAEDRATILLRDYAWQFEKSSANDAKSEDELKEEQRANPVVPANEEETRKPAPEVIVTEAETEAPEATQQDESIDGSTNDTTSDPKALQEAVEEVKKEEPKTKKEQK